MERRGLIFLFKPWYANIKKWQVKALKVYVRGTGMRTGDES